MRLHRARKQAGLRCLTLEVPENETPLWSEGAFFTRIAILTTGLSGQRFMRFSTATLAAAWGASPNEWRFSLLHIARTTLTDAICVPPVF